MTHSSTDSCRALDAVLDTSALFNSKTSYSFQKRHLYTGIQTQKLLGTVKTRFSLRGCVRSVRIEPANCPQNVDTMATVQSTWWGQAYHNKDKADRAIVRTRVVLSWVSWVVEERRICHVWSK